MAEEHAKGAARRGTPSIFFLRDLLAQCPEKNRGTDYQKNPYSDKHSGNCVSGDGGN